ncbi:uncharacterized protein [Physcomitrium patens]|uniref:uncharacterized protein isoform X2 n=1 Tax=Physcomitrium patens TaxID=3218 RepID=UPI000D17A6E3|nr:vegetative incompatibility protein HET-E-1-like isoform X2 [Physcomitrium patens]|eukprot:XP_024388402.1 vegetative incompatibility protein HET-E-1-like isoform X2 [Physcomitrella patens]
MNMNSFSFFECFKDLKTELLEDEGDVERKLVVDANEEAALDEEEKNEYIAMKQELEEMAEGLEKRAANPAISGRTRGFVEHVRDNAERGENLQPYAVISMKSAEATCTRFSRDSDDLLAIGTSAGIVEIYNAQSGRFSYKLDVGRKGMRKWSITSLSFRSSKFAKVAQNMLVSCDIKGQIHHWHATSEKHLSMSLEPDNEILAVDHHPTGQKFATSGYDCKVRIYDGITRLPIQTFEKGNGVTTAGHSNRVVALKWHPSDIDITLSGGWDKTVQVWDARAGTSVRSLYGMEIYGDALDIKEGNNHVLTGSWRRRDQLQEWDFGSGQLIENLCWPPGNVGVEPCRLYCAVYGTGFSQNLIAAGGSGSNEACLIDANSRDVVGRISTGDKAVHGVAFSRDGTQLAVLTPASVHLFSIAKALSAASNKHHHPAKIDNEVIQYVEEVTNLKSKDTVSHGKL